MRSSIATMNNKAPSDIAPGNQSALTAATYARRLQAQANRNSNGVERSQRQQEMPRGANATVGRSLQNSRGAASTNPPSPTSRLAQLSLLINEALAIVEEDPMEEGDGDYFSQRP